MLILWFSIIGKSSFCSVSLEGENFFCTSDIHQDREFWLHDGYYVINNLIFSPHSYFMAFHVVFACERSRWMFGFPRSSPSSSPTFFSRCIPGSAKLTNEVTVELWLKCQPFCVQRYCPSTPLVLYRVYWQPSIILPRDVAQYFGLHTVSCRAEGDAKMD